MPAGVALALLALVLAPTVAWFDSGELAAAAVEPGVPHPTGFAVFDLAGHAWARLPLASAALRVHLLGAAAAVAAVALWRRALGLRGKGTLAVALLLLPLAAPSLLLHVRAAEVYPLAWLATAAGIWAFAVLPAGRAAATLGLLAGLGAGVHVEAAALTGVLALTALARLTRETGLRVAVQAAVTTGVLAVAAAAAVVYLPLAAARQPRLSWGDLQTATALLDHLTGASIRAAFADRIGEGGDGWLALGRRLGQEGALLLGPALLGVVGLLRSEPPRRRALAATLAVLLVDAGYSATVNPMGLRDGQAGLLALLALGVLAGAGLQTLVALLAADRAGTDDSVRLTVRIRSGIAAALAVIAVATVSLRTLHAAPTSDLEAGGRLADRLLQDVAPGALLITASDHAASACLWLQAGEGARPDALCLPGVFARDARMLQAIAATTGRPGFAAAATRTADPPSSKRSADVLAAWLRPALIAGNVFWEQGLADEDAQVVAHLRGGLPWSTVHAERQGAGGRAYEPGRLVAEAESLCVALASPAATPGDPACARAPTLARHLGVQLGLHGAQRMRHDPTGARQLLEAAQRLAPETPRILNNLAVLELESGQPELALAWCQRALAAEPDYRRAQRTAARAALRAGRAERAVEHARRYLGNQRGTEALAWLEALAVEAEAKADGATAAALRGLAEP